MNTRIAVWTRWGVNFSRMHRWSVRHKNDKPHSSGLIYTERRERCLGRTMRASGAYAATSQYRR